MGKVEKILNTSNKFLIDWFSFTSKVDSASSIVDLLGLSKIKFQTIYGCQGYKQRLYFDGINIHFGSERNPGVWVEMSGQGCRNFETYSDITFEDLFNIVVAFQDDYHVTRLDVAYDDFSHVIPLKKLSKQVLDSHFVSKFHEKSCLVTQASGCNGITVDLGSCKSDIRFRVYDKAYERQYFDEIANGFTWVRWEMQLRDTSALNFLVKLQNDTVGGIFKGVLLNYFRPVDVNKSDSNKRRWNTSRWFSRFVDSVSKISLFTSCKSEYNLARCENYAYHQAGNAIDTLIKIKGVETFLRELSEQKPETTLKYKELYNQHLLDERGLSDA